MVIYMGYKILMETVEEVSWKELEECMFDLRKFSDKLLQELCKSELSLQKCGLCDLQLLEDISKEIEKRGLSKSKKGKKK